MARHSFIQMSKLSDVKGRISYISDPKRQEYLYATFSTREDMTFWNDLAKECQEEFKRFGTEGKCIEARELIIALPEEYTQFDPNRVLREFTEQFKKRYDVECVSALHHNKTRKPSQIISKNYFGSAIKTNLLCIIRVKGAMKNEKKTDYIDSSGLCRSFCIGSFFIQAAGEKPLGITYLHIFKGWESGCHGASDKRTYHGDRHRRGG